MEFLSTILQIMKQFSGLKAILPVENKEKVYAKLKEKKL